MRDLLPWLLMVVCVVSLAGCRVDVHRLEYANLDEVAVDATGKQLWELEFGDREIGLVKKKLWGTKMESLHCIRDNAHTRYRGAHELSGEQAQRRTRNIKVLVKEALLPTIEMRESEAKREIVLSGCNN